MDPLKKELWRLRINWLITWFIIPLYTTSQIGISSSFHQFITNPTLEQIKNGTYQELEPGLGESELVYSLLIAGFAFGAMIGGFVSGVLLQWVPYWYLWQISLLTHIIGYIIYCVSYNWWLIMLSRLLAGYILGAIVTLSFTYYAKTSETYVETQRKLGRKTNKTSVVRTRNILFALNAFSYSTGYLIGPGSAVIFAQFKYIDQFRAIGWFNVAYGVTASVLVMLLFRGEINCEKFKVKRCFKLCKENSSKKSVNNSRSWRIRVLPAFIIVTLIILSFVERVRLAVVQTLVNPIASDSFGMNERDTSYIFLAFGIPQYAGAIVLLVFQCMHISNQVITLFGMLITISGYLILTDFQAISYDPCTVYSPFHHPAIITDYYNSSQFSDNFGNSLPILQSTNTPAKVPTLEITSEFHLETVDGLSFDVNINSLNKFDCEHVKMCSCNRSSPCLHFQMQPDMSLHTTYFSNETYHCISDKIHIPICVHAIQSLQSQTPYAKISSINILPQDEYLIVRNKCVQANITGHQCHWIPSSTITKKECEDCQPICRSVHQTLTFPQFIAGMALLVFANSLQFAPIVALITNQSPKQLLGVVIGCMTALNSIIRTISPLILDALYESVQKRIFVFTLMMVALHIPFIIEIIVLYPKLGPRTDFEDKAEPDGYFKLRQDEPEEEIKQLK